MRLGYVAANERIIKRLNAHINPWNTNSLAGEVILEILNNLSEIEKFKKKTNAFIKKEKKFIYCELEKINQVTVYESATNFLLIKVPINSTILTKKLYEKGIFVRDCSNFRNLGNKYVRICIRSHEDNKKLLYKFKEVLS